MCRENFASPRVKTKIDLSRAKKFVAFVIYPRVIVRNASKSQNHEKALTHLSRFVSLKFCLLFFSEIHLHSNKIDVFEGC